MNIQRKRIRIDSKISRNTAFTSPRKDKREIDILLELSLNTIPRKSISPEAYEIAERYFTKGDKRMAETWWNHALRADPEFKPSNRMNRTAQDAFEKYVASRAPTVQAQRPSYQH